MIIKKFIIFVGNIKDNNDCTLDDGFGNIVQVLKLNLFL